MWMQGAPAAGEPVAVSAATGRPALAGGSPEADTALGRTQPETWFVALVFGAATLFFGIVPSPLFDLATKAGGALTNLL